MTRRLHWIERGAWIVVGVLVGASVTGLASQGTQSLYRKLEVLAEVLGHIENKYVDKVSPDDLIKGAINGAVDTLDPHSIFFAPKEYAALLEMTGGEYTGIGIEIDIQNNQPVVVAAFDTSPAQEVGIRHGDVIERVDGKSTLGVGYDVLDGWLRGPVGSKVVVEVRRGDRKIATHTLKRRWIRVSPLIHNDLGKGRHYIRISSFVRRLAIDLDAMLTRLAPIHGLILDLRNNPGGLFDESVEVCDLFLDGGPIVSALGRGGRLLEEHVARPGLRHGKFPLAVLVDRGSASAAEIVAGALQDRQRARLFGQRTYGKGSVQTIIDLTDGSGLKLTVARYITPGGRQLEGHGIEPDEVILPKDDEDVVLQRAQRWLVQAPENP
ncbi:MAG: S41 family peptidase [Myxococcota bacterium]